jgi:hypothetical protein
LQSRFTRIIGLFLGFVVSAGLAGCGSGDDLPRKAVSGTVTLGGQPLAEGRIQFAPVSPDAKVDAGGEIKNGQFSIPRDQGPTPGDYRVMITSAVPRKAGPDNAPGAEPSTRGPKMPDSTGPAPELIPKEYNSKTTLTAKVEADKTNTYDFPLKK